MTRAAIRSLIATPITPAKVFFTLLGLGAPVLGIALTIKMADALAGVDGAVGWTVLGVLVAVVVLNLPPVKSAPQSMQPPTDREIACLRILVNALYAMRIPTAGLFLLVILASILRLVLLFVLFH